MLDHSRHRRMAGNGCGNQKSKLDEVGFTREEKKQKIKQKIKDQSTVQKYIFEPIGAIWRV